MPEENLAPDVSPDSPYQDGPETPSESPSGENEADAGQDAAGDADPVLDAVADLGEAGDMLLVAWGSETGEKLEAARNTAHSILGDVSPEARTELIEAFDAMPAREQAKIFQRLAGNARPATPVTRGNRKMPNNIDARIEAKRAERDKAQGGGKHDKAKQIDAELMDLYRMKTGPEEPNRTHFEGRIPASALARGGL